MSDGGHQIVQVAAPPLRWSSVRDCPRKAVYEAEQAPHRERTRKEERALYRGKTVGQAYVVALAHENGWKVHVASGPDFMLPYPGLRADNEETADVLAELKVQWELGVGHPDVYVKETDTVIEVLSSQHASADMVRSKLLQAMGYVRALDAQSLALAVIDPVTLEEERIIVTAPSAQWDDLAAECDDRVAEVLAWRDNGQLPDRVCARPSEAWGHFCQYADHCFQDWQPPALDAIDSEEAQLLAIQLATIKGKRRELSSSDKVFEQEQKDIQAQLEPLIPAGEFQVGGYQVKRSDRTRQSFKLTLAQQDSRIPDSLLDEFTSVSTYTVWDCTKTGPAAVTADEEAPWTEADLG